jgi:hypothetical protein
VDRLTPEQQALWQRVIELWELSRTRDEARIRALLHPDYAGWDMRSPFPHDREAAVRSVCGDTPRLDAYTLDPLSVRVYGHTVGVVHYRYTATLGEGQGGPVEVTGQWTEVYLHRDGAWVMVAVSGRPEAP